MAETRPARCRECGALQVNGLTCFEQLGWLIGWESEDPELANLHFFSVACYNLQHPAQFSAAALMGLRRAFCALYEGRTTVGAVRQQMNAAFDGKTRVLKEASQRQPVLRSWAVTIADIYLPDQPQGAAERVRRWMAVVYAEVRETDKSTKGRSRNLPGK